MARSSSLGRLAAAVLLAVCVTGLAAAKPIKNAIPDSGVVTIRLATPKAKCETQGYLTASSCGKKDALWGQRVSVGIQSWWRITPNPDGTAYVQSEARVEGVQPKCKTFLSAFKACRKPGAYFIAAPKAHDNPKWVFEPAGAPNSYRVRFAARPKACPVEYLGQSRKQCTAKVQLSKLGASTSTVWIVEPAQPYKVKILNGFVAKGTKAAVQPSALDRQPRDIVLDIAPPTVGEGAITGYKVVGNPLNGVGGGIVFTTTGIKRYETIRIVIPPEMYVAGTHYAFVVYAMNGLTPSYPSNVIQVATMPAAPVIHSVVVEPPNDREPFGSIAVTTNIPKDGGSEILSFTVIGEPKEEDKGYPTLTYTGMGQWVAGGKRVFKFSQEKWPRDEEYEFHVTAHNKVGHSSASEDSPLETPYSLPDAPEIEDVVAVADCTKGENVLSVFLSPPAYKGSGEEKPYAQGEIVSYKVTAVPKEGPTLYVEGEGEPENDWVVLSFKNVEHQDGMEYTVTAIAVNEFGESEEASEPFIHTTPRRPDAPVIESIEFLSPTALEPLGPMAVTITEPFNGGDAIFHYTLIGWAEDEDDEIISTIKVIGMGEELGDGKRVFKIGQAEWMRNVEYEFVVSATNHFCTSDNSTAYEAPLSPYAVPTPPTVLDAVAESNCAEGVNVLSVSIKPPANNGSSVDLPFAQGKIVSYNVTAQPEVGTRITVAGLGQLQDDGTIGFSFQNKEHQDGMLYFITAAAFNEFGGSALSETFEYTTPRRPFPPTIESVVVLPSPASRRRLQEDAPPSLEREPFGRMAITVANTSDGGSPIQDFTVIAWAEDDDDVLISRIVYTGMGDSLPDGKRVFMFDQTSWMRNVEYDIVVSATNAFCTSDNSTEAEILTPYSLPDPPTVVDAVAESNCAEGTNVLRVYLSGPGYNGSSKQLPFAQGQIVNYIVTAVPLSDDADNITTEGAGVLQADSTVELQFENKAHRDGEQYSITAVAENEFGDSAVSEAFVYNTPRRPYRPRIHSVVAEDPTDEEVLGAIAVTVNETYDGGSPITSYTVIAWAEENDEIISRIEVAGMGTELPDTNQRVFKLPQADWMRDEEYEVVVSATNAFCESGNSTEEEFETPFAAPDPPTIDEVVVEANCTEGVDVLTVYLTPPANKGSGKTVQFAETGKIVKYIVTAEPESGPTITVAGEGEVEDDGSVELKFANYEHQHSMEYTVTAIAVNEFGESKPSKAVTYTTPRRPDTPVIDSVEVLPPTDREPFGAIAVTVTETDDGGSPITSFTVFGWAEDDDDKVIGLGNLTYIGMGEDAPDGKHVFKFDQTEYLRDVEYHFIVRATNELCHSDWSEDEDVDTPFSLSDPPTIVDAVAESNCTAGTNVLSVFLTPPTYNGSSLEQPYAEGKIVKYNVTATPKEGDAITTEGTGVVQPDNTVMLSFPNKEHADGTNYSITATAFNEFGESKPSEAFWYQTPRRPKRPIVDSVVVLPPTDVEPFGSIAITVNETWDGGAPITTYTVIATAEDDEDNVISTIKVTGMGDALPDGQRVFLIPQEQYMRDVEYEVVVTATNDFCESKPSNQGDVDTPAADPFPPTIAEVKADCNCSLGLDQLHVYLTPPTNNGSGMSEPFATGVIVKYVVTAVPESGEILTTEGPGAWEDGLVELTFANKEHQSEMNYTITAIAWNEFGESEASAPVVYLTPRRPDAPTIDSVVFQPPTAVEPLGAMAVTITPPFDGGDAIQDYTIVAWATEADEVISHIHVTGAGDPQPDGTLLFLIGQENWMRNTQYEVVAVASNGLCESVNSTAYLTAPSPFALPEAPTIDEVEVEANCTEGEDVLTVYVTPPAVKGSGTDLPFAETGTIVKYTITAVPVTGPTITTEGPGVLQDDGTYEVAFPNKEHQDGVEYGITATAWNEFGESVASSAFTYTTPRHPDAPTIDSVVMEPPTDREAFGSISITITEAGDGGSPITSYTVFGWAVDESDQPIEMGNLTVTELGTALPSGQRLLTVPQTEFMRGVEYYFVVRATNAHCHSDWSADEDVDVPFSPPDAPTVEDASIVSNCTAGDNTLRVFISGPGYNGSSLTKPFAEGHIVKYVVTAVPETGTTIETEGAGVLQPSGWVALSFPNLVHQFNMTYNITAVAENDFGPSQPSAVFQYTTPVPANAPILDFVEVLPPTDREAFGSLAITINTTADGGSPVTSYTVTGTAKDQNDIVFSEFTLVSMGDELPDGQRVFLIDQADWMRNATYTIVVTATNAVCTPSNLSNSKIFTTPFSVPDAPTINSTVLVANFPGPDNALTVYLTPPAYKGSGDALPFAESGIIVKYVVTAVPETAGATITTEGPGVLQADGTYEVAFANDAHQADTNYTITAVVWNEFGESVASEPFQYIAGVGPPQAPVIDNVQLLTAADGRRRLQGATTELEPFGPLAVTINETSDGGGAIQRYTVIATFDDEVTGVGSTVMFTGLGDSVPDTTNQRVFKIGQANWMRGTLYNITVSATNEFGQSKNSSVYQFDYPYSLPDAPIIAEADNVANYPLPDNAIHVYLTPPAYKGSGKEQPYAEGKIVKYNVTAVPDSGPTITVAGAGVLEDDGTFELKFANDEHQSNMNYSITATAFNEFGESVPSAPFLLKTLRRPFPPTILSVSVLPPNDREPMGDMAVAISNDTADGGSPIWQYTMYAVSADGINEILSTGMGTVADNGDILLPVPQAQWPRDTLLNITVAATNNFGESKNSTAYEFTTPFSVSDPPTITNTTVVPNAVEDELSDVLVLLTPPAYLGSGKDLPYADTGKIVNYTVTIQLASGAEGPITIQGMGTPQADGSVELVFSGLALMTDQDYNVTATATNEFGVSAPSNNWFFGPSRVPDVPVFVGVSWDKTANEIRAYFAPMGFPENGGADISDYRIDAVAVYPADAGALAGEPIPGLSLVSQNGQGTAGGPAGTHYFTFTDTQWLLDTEYLVTLTATNINGATSDAPSNHIVMRPFTDVGDACFGGSPPSGLAMATDRNGKSWVAFVETDPAFAGHVTVMSLEAGVWTAVGARGFSDFAGINDTAFKPTLAFSKGNVPYVAFESVQEDRDADNVLIGYSTGVVVMSFNGTDWALLPFAAGADANRIYVVASAGGLPVMSSIQMAVAATATLDDLYLTFSSPAFIDLGFAPQVYFYNTTLDPATWEQLALGTPTWVDGDGWAFGTSIAADADGNVLVTSLVQGFEIITAGVEAEQKLVASVTKVFISADPDVPRQLNAVGSLIPVVAATLTTGLDTLKTLDLPAGDISSTSLAFGGAAGTSPLVTIYLTQAYADLVDTAGTSLTGFFFYDQFDGAIADENPVGIWSSTVEARLNPTTGAYSVILDPTAAAVLTVVDANTGLSSLERWQETHTAGTFAWARMCEYAYPQILPETLVASPTLLSNPASTAGAVLVSFLDSSCATAGLAHVMECAAPVPVYPVAR